MLYTVLCVLSAYTMPFALSACAMLLVLSACTMLFALSACAMLCVLPAYTMLSALSACREARGEEAGGKPASATSSDSKPGSATSSDSKPGSTTSSDSKPASADSGDSKLARCVESLFGLRYRQRLVALSGKRGERSREARTFQIDLQYPSKASSGSGIPKVAASPLASPAKAPAGRAAASPVKDSPSAPIAATNSPGE